MLNANLIESVKIKINLLLGKDKRMGSVGILDRGRGTKMYNNTFIGLDTAIKEEGEDAEAIGNKILK
ncbi:hypothetical protein A2886_02890 [candidate division WWE3 bacterium RIFCSPHIGHO2_01_FULL_42_13]|uniref:Uncharacterized protein n=1 Tax=candidate division WWE3 bacterium RIFCSPHIGHO2_01_FULL_42_13 TaxID=1802617 RepID=A0A1F4URT4_UNCKA|nr:MAG: hypothetical protein A2886_02890 [candidate division WWE3 bacterium RIFCSPHIGHO2_01_FULL_42_13]